jgi:capsular polysaccharide transport system permease protein
MALRNRIAATRARLEEERRRFASPQGERLNLQAAEFQKLTMDAGFAQDLYRSSLESFDNIRIEASRKFKSLVVIASPSVPELALYPRRLYNLLTLFLLLTLVYGITRLVIATVEDHRD